MNDPRRILFGIVVVCLVASTLAGCSTLNSASLRPLSTKPLTTSAALGSGDLTRDASLRLVIAGLDDEIGGRPSRALAGYQRAIRVDPTNAFAYLALARHHLASNSTGEASAFLDQAHSLFEQQGQLGIAIDVWGIGLRAGIDRQEGRDDLADSRFESARQLSPEIWDDERLSAAELR